jgi:hypothetical protein
MISIAVQQDKNCPHCGTTQTDMIQRKHGIWQLRRCNKCLLMFRWPKENPESASHFYQDAYREGRTTDVPTSAELDRLLKIGFAGDNIGYQQRIQTVQSVSTKKDLLDYGASWGYGVWQFDRAGYNASGFEIGKPRANYGREHLGVKIETAVSAF